MNPPRWAQDLMLKAMLWWEEQGHVVPPVSLTWRRCSKRPSTGRTMFVDRDSVVSTTRIVVTAGRSRRDQKLLLLHELAHAMLPRGEYHSALFWDTAWVLYRWAKLPLRYAQRREGRYRRGALVAYRRSVSRGKQ